jgi:hypothetical protein
MELLRLVHKTAVTGPWNKSLVFMGPLLQLLEGLCSLLVISTAGISAWLVVKKRKK